jgi:beta-glucosidase
MHNVSLSLGGAAAVVLTLTYACAPKSHDVDTRASAGSAGSAGSAASASTAGASAGAGASCGQGVLRGVENGHDLLPGYSAPPDPRVATWLAEMSPTDQAALMQGLAVSWEPNYQDINRNPDVHLADGTVFRGFTYTVASRGLNLDAGQPIARNNDSNDFSTAFPAVSLRGASWDLELEWQVGEAIGDEGMASFNDLLIGPPVNILRHPYWGQAQATYGEDTYHVGRMGTAFVAGVQQHVAACAQDFLASGVEATRWTLNAVVDEQSLREIYARPLELLVTDGGVACVMTAYGWLNGVLASENAYLLRDILKNPVAQGGFGFRGFVMSEWWDVPQGQSPPDPATAQANATALANAGLDIEQPWARNYGQLPTVLGSGQVTADTVRDAAARILEQKARFQSALSTDGYGLAPPSSTLDGGSIATNDTHLALAERAAAEATVLLTNGTPGAPVLPIPSGVNSIAVIGAAVEFTLASSSVPKSCPQGEDFRNCTFQFATDVALGDRGDDRVNADPAQSIGPFAGIQSAAQSHGVVTVTHGETAQDAANADLVVVVVGLTPGDEGEDWTIASGGDRTTLTLPAAQADLVNSVLSLTKPTVVVIESGSVVATPWLNHANQNQATIWAGYGGMRGGAALGKLLFGDVNFGGKLPLTWAAESALPPFTDDSQTATLPYLVGYRDYDQRTANGAQPNVVFPFGHGLSYTTFAYSDPVVPCTEVRDGAVLDVTVNIANTGYVSGDEVAFLFVAGPPATSEPRSVKELKSFARVSLDPGAQQTVHLPVRIHDLRHFSAAENQWVIDSGAYTVLVGPSADAADLSVAGTFDVP